MTLSSFAVCEIENDDDVEEEGKGDQCLLFSHLQSPDHLLFISRFNVRFFWFRCFNPLFHCLSLWLQVDVRIMINLRREEEAAKGLLNCPIAGKGAAESGSSFRPIG